MSRRKPHLFNALKTDLRWQGHCSPLRRFPLQQQPSGGGDARRTRCRGPPGPAPPDRRPPRRGAGVAAMWSRSRRASSRKKLTAFLDEGSEIEGKYTFTGTVLLNGKFQGEIASPDTLIIGERGVVNACIRAGTLVVNGELVGNVYASERVELSGKARVLGDVQAPIVVLEEGVMFEGHCKMPRPGTVDATGESVVAALEHS